MYYELFARTYWIGWETGFLLGLSLGFAVGLATYMTARYVCRKSY